MNRFHKIALSAVALGLCATAGTAATLTLEGEPQFQLDAAPGNYNPNPDAPFEVPVLAFGADVVGGDVGGGVYLDLGSGETATITYTIEGQESGFFNILDADGTQLFENQIGSSSVTSQLIDGYLSFGFTSEGYDPAKSIWNGGTSEVASFHLGLGAIEQLSATSWELYAYFGDGVNDNDFDDLVASIRVDVAAVPLPASAFLLIAGLGGLGVARRRKS